MNVRTIVEESAKNVAVMDVFSKLVQERIIFIDDVIDDDLANGVIAQMLYLSALDKDKLINIYINSPGGILTSGLAIYDVAKLIKTPIRTVCIGQAASMGAILMLMGKERCGLKHSRFMLHQPSGRAFGKYEDIKIDFEEITILRQNLYNILKEHTSIPDIEEHLKLDRWFSSKTALEFGLITEILE